MTGRADKNKNKGSSSLPKKKTKTKCGAVSAANTPITSFFSSPQPAKVSCPLCGLLVPKFKINEHIDLQCKNFEGGNSADSASNSVVLSIQLSPTRNPHTSPVRDPKEEEEDKAVEIQRSPYFKNTQPVPREIISKTVVRTLDLGSLSSKLRRRSRQNTQKEDPHPAPIPVEAEDSLDTPSSSQKENLPLQTFEDQGGECVNSVTTIDLTAHSPEMPPSAEHPLCLPKQSEAEIFAEQVTPQLLPSSSKPTKRKKETNGKTSSFRKKAKYNGSSTDAEKVLSSAGTSKTTEVSCTTTRDPLSTPEEADGTSAGENDMLHDKANTNRTVETSPPLRLPYYLRNFQTVLQAVLENEDDRTLFNQDDMSYVHAFEKLSGMSEDHSLICYRTFR